MLGHRGLTLGTEGRVHVRIPGIDVLGPVEDEIHVDPDLARPGGDHRRHLRALRHRARRHRIIAIGRQDHVAADQQVLLLPRRGDQSLGVPELGHAALFDLFQVILSPLAGIHTLAQHHGPHVDVSQGVGGDTVLADEVRVFVEVLLAIFADAPDQPLRQNQIHARREQKRLDTHVHQARNRRWRIVCVQRR